MKTLHTYLPSNIRTRKLGPLAYKSTCTYATIYCMSDCLVWLSAYSLSERQVAENTTVTIMIIETLSVEERLKIFSLKYFEWVT